ncbi:hypothetical protein A3746_14275 [Oleibacter sp. HI0075]|nr:hypothetical protein A3746_14275 [Oleibacter sp. HI0075]
MSDLSLCPICDEGHLHTRSEVIEVEHAGRCGYIKSLHSECDECGSETATAAQVRQNKRAMIAFKKQAEGLMTGAEVKAMRLHLGLSQEQAARMFGGGPVAFSKYENDDVIQSEPMNNLLKVSKRLPIAAAYLAKEANVILKNHSHLTAGFNLPPYVRPELGQNTHVIREHISSMQILNSDRVEVVSEEFQNAS